MASRTRFITVITSIALVITCITIPVAADKLSDLRSEERANQEKIEAKRAQIAQYNSELERLGAELAGYDNDIRILQVQINALEAEISLSEAERDELESQIAQLEIKIENNKDVLGYALRELYNTKNVSLIERLASSQDFSSFIDKEAQLDNISVSLTEIVAAIESDKAELEDKKVAVQAVLDKLSDQKSIVDGEKARLQELRNYSQSQQNSYTALKGQAAAEQLELEREQMRILAAISVELGGGADTYKYKNVCPERRYYHVNSWNWIYTDEWNMYQCECVSYTSWKVHEQYLLGLSSRDMPRWGGNRSNGLQGGNARYWVNNAKVSGIPTGKTPKAGSVAVRTSYLFSNDPGHVAWVEADGTVWQNGVEMILVSEYNGVKEGDYWRGYQPRSRYSDFIYFNER